LQPSTTDAPPETAAAPAPREVTALTRAMARGDETAYRQFHEAYFQRIFRYLLVAAAGDEDAAREAVQATFLRVVRYVKPFDAEGRFWHWLTVLARTALTDQRRKRSRYRAFLERFTRHAQAELPASPANNGQADTQLLTVLERALQALSPEERDLVERKYFAGESVRDIAAAQQLSEKAIESRLTRTRLKLKSDVLQKLKHETPD
jgi:RNA polymerase sigma factor (sigma-70 family)